jgi:hypothetical protein
MVRACATSNASAPCCSRGAALTIAGLIHFVVARTRRHLRKLQRLPISRNC